MSKAKTNPPLRLEYVDPRKLDGNPLNWKKHTKRQYAALNATLDTNGWAGAALYNERTKRLIDGHGRKELAIKRGDKVIPVLIGSWTEEQEKQILATLDPIGSMAQTNAAALQSLLAGNQKSIGTIKSKKTKETLSRLTKDISNYARDIEEGNAPSVLLDRSRPATSSSPERTEESDDGVYETTLKDDHIFPSDLPWGIPELRSDVLCSSVPDRVWSRGSAEGNPWFCYSAGITAITNAEDREGGTLGFYTEDYRFEMAWNDSKAFTERLLSLDFEGVCLPDFSQWDDWPAVVNLHNLYRSRWCGRYWQEVGIPVIPLLQSLGDAEEYADILFETLPVRPPVVASQCRTGDDKAAYFQSYCDFLKLSTSIVKPETVIIYGGKDNEKYLQGYLPHRKGTKYVLLPSFQALRRAKKK